MKKITALILTCILLLFPVACTDTLNETVITDGKDPTLALSGSEAASTASELVLPSEGVTDPGDRTVIYSNGLTSLSPNGSLTVFVPYDPKTAVYNKEDGTVVITDQLRTATEENNDPDALFAVSVNCHSQYYYLSNLSDCEKELSLFYDKADGLLKEYGEHARATGHLIKDFPTEKTEYNPDFTLVNTDCPDCESIFDGMTEVMEAELKIRMESDSRLDELTMAATEEFCAYYPELFIEPQQLRSLNLVYTSTGETVKYRDCILTYLTEDAIFSLEKTLKEGPFSHRLALQVDILPEPDRVFFSI